MPSPLDILSQMNQPPHWDGWVPTFSGKGYRPWGENPGSLSITDLSYGLAHTYRYGGQSQPAVTVAEHCVLVATIIQILWPGNRHLERAGLFHDAAESVLHDIQSPLRRKVQVVLPTGEIISWNESDFRVTLNISKPYGVMEEHLRAPEVKAADILAACFEKRDCPNLREGDWGLPGIPEEVAHLKVQGWSPEEAQTWFMHFAGVLGDTSLD